MNDKVLIYRINEIPDSLYSSYQMAAGGDVLMAAGCDFEHLLRTVAGFPPGSLSLTIRFIFNPDIRKRDMQSRLNLYLIANAQDKSIRENLRILIERGPLNRFFDMEKIEGFEFTLQDIEAVSEIVRREDGVDPLYSNEFNDRIPSFYYTIDPFKPNDGNDYMDLDRTLGEIKEKVIIDICIQPVDIEKELAKHTQYLSFLQSINRIWDHEENNGLEFQDYFSDCTKWHSSKSRKIKPLRYEDPLAENILQSQQRFHETLRKPHLLFHIRIFSKEPSTSHLIGSVLAESAFEGGSYRLLSHTDVKLINDELFKCLKDYSVSTFPTLEYLFRHRDSTLYSGFDRLSHVTTIEEFLGAFRIPIALNSSPVCIRMNTDPPYISEREAIILGFDKDNSSLCRGPNLAVMPKHCFISGVPGSGKTTSAHNIVIQLHQYGIPFLIIEPVKTEYRILKTFKNHPDENVRSLAEELEIYTPGDESVSPYRINPLSLLPGISVYEHIDNILSCFKAAIPLEGSLPALLGETIERVYDEQTDMDRPPIMAELVAVTNIILTEKGYSQDTNSDFRAAIEARLGVLIRRSVGKIFQCRHSVPTIHHLVNASAIIEFDRLHPEQACLCILFLLTYIREYLKTTSKVEAKPRYAIIIEEAHNIVGRTGTAVASPDVADPKAFAAEYIVRMLAELRALGVIIIIVDQLPTSVATEVIKNTTTKLAFRQVDKDDREIIGESILLNQSEIEELARLNPGEAFFYTEGYYKPRKIKTINLHKDFNFDSDICNEKIVPYLLGDIWFKKAALKRTFLELTHLREHMDVFEETRLAMIREFAVMSACLPQVQAQDCDNKGRLLAKLKLDAYKFQSRLRNSYELFIRDSYKRYMDCRVEFKTTDALVEEMKDDLVSRFESIIKPDVKKTLAMLEGFISRCHKTEK